MVGHGLVAKEWCDADRRGAYVVLWANGRLGTIRAGRDWRYRVEYHWGAA